MADETLPRHYVESILDEHGTFIEKVARRFSNGQSDPEDIVQTVALKLCMRPLPELRRANIRSYLFSMVRNAAHDMFRNEVPHEMAKRAFESGAQIGALPEPVEDPYEVVRERERADRLRRAIRKLPAKSRVSARDQLKGRPVSVDSKTKSRAFRARHSLRDILERDPLFER